MLECLKNKLKHPKLINLKTVIVFNY